MSLTGAPLRDPDRVRVMAQTLAHRGPDGEGIVGDDTVRLGARRLAIVDLATGDQPFQNPDGSLSMVCNGEIYNAPALRREACGWGYPFRSRSDIETILPLYERLGASAIARLEGMFGLAIWDARRRVLLLARDRAGEKPLFWTESAGELRFASELQALLAYPDQARRLDPQAAEQYAALGYVPAPRTLLAGVRKLPPAHLLEADAHGISIRPFWDARTAASAPSTGGGPEDLQAALLRAVERELMADVPLGVFTSGGLDSSILAAAAARVVPAERLHTYAVRFVAPGYDESAHAAAVTRDIRTVHHVVTADEPALARALTTITATLGEPVGDPAILPTFLLADAAREHVKVILSGEGADELFGGYPTYVGHEFAQAYGRLPRPLRRLAGALIRGLPVSTGKVTLEFLLKQFVGGAELAPLARHIQWFGALGPTPAVLGDLEERLRGFPEGDPLNRILWLDFLTYLPDNLLVKVDRGTMLASIEARAPYLDREIMELALPLPSRQKVRGFGTKLILKEAARGLVPASVIARRKRGLSVPVAGWLNAGLGPLADRLLTRPRLAGERIPALLAEHRRGRANHARKLWPALVAELWAERWNVEAA